MLADVAGNTGMNVANVKTFKIWNEDADGVQDMLAVSASLGPTPLAKAVSCAGKKESKETRRT
jgi:hypothetical protein